MSGSPETMLRIRDLHKSFSGAPALKGISLDVDRGSVTALIGPSGCGKTTLLRCIAGLTQPDDGDLEIGGEVMNSGRRHRPPESRGIGMVFQDYALWPHMTVAENVAFPLEMSGMDRSTRREKVAGALKLVGLEAMADRSPGTLSGGQQQRVSLARAVVNEPRLLLMDEPLSNLDKNLRESLALDIRHLIERLHLTAVFVTHDQQEAYALSDHVAVLQGGRVAQIERPERLYQYPATADIARFLDAGTLVQGELSEQGLILGSHRIEARPAISYRGPMDVLVQRQALHLSHLEESDLIARVEGRLFQGESYTLRLRLSPEVSLRLESNYNVAVGDSVGLRVDRRRLIAWDPDGVRHFPLIGDGSSVPVSTMKAEKMNERPGRSAQ